MTTFEIPLIVDSDTAAGAINKTADGSTFEIELNDPITIPADATNVTVQVQEATIWWVIPNIITGDNDTFSLDDGLGGGPYVITVPQGLYNLNGLQQSVESALVTAGSAPSQFTFIADNATQKVIIRLNAIGVTVDFTVGTTFATILGFLVTDVLGPTVVAQTDFTASNVAAFNVIDFFLIHSDIVPQGIRINSSYNQTIAQVLIDTTPGKQIVSRPFNPPKSEAQNLIGALRRRLKFWLTTQDGTTLVNTNSENWSARVIISYTHDKSVGHEVRTNLARLVRN